MSKTNSLKKLPYFPWKPNPNFTKSFPYLKNFQNCTNKSKINLFSLEYKKNGESFICPSVQKAMNLYTSQKIQRFGYLPLNGDEDFVRKNCELILNKNKKNGKLAGIFDYNEIVVNQALGASGGVLLSFYLLKSIYKSNKIYFPNKTSPFQSNLAENLGFEVSFFKFFDFNQNKLDFENCLYDLDKIDNGSIIFFEPINHSSGLTFENSQWEEIAEICKKKNFLLILNLPNFGSYKGSFSNDSEIIQSFVNKNIQLLISNGLSSSFSLYGHRLGSLLMLNQSEKKIPLLKDLLAHITRNTYNFYPRYSSDIANIIFKKENLFEELQNNLFENFCDLEEKKKMFFKFLFKRNYPFWKNMENQNGMFLFTGLNGKQNFYLREKFGIHIFLCGKLSISELNNENMEYIADCLNEALEY